MRSERKWLLRTELAVRVLLLAAALLLRPADGGGPGLDETAIMSRLRQLAHDSGVVKADMHWGGWDPEDRTHHCMWHHIQCNAEQHITHLQLLNDVNFLGGHQASQHGNVTTPLARPLALPPELAQLRHLQELELVIYGYAVDMPAEWGRPGAFPRLERLFLQVLGFMTPSPLPPVEPGALPALQTLEFYASQQEAPLQLPPSWGRPGVWPSLQSLIVQAAIALPLPASWSQGFPQLTKLVLSAAEPSSAAGTRPSLAGPAAAAAAAAGPASSADAVASWLPNSWPHGFPSLETLALNGLGLSGPFPAAWQAKDAFPSLRDLSLRGNNLTGPLPRLVACNLPMLMSLELTNNQFTGQLPSEWGVCQSPLLVVHLTNNQLVGPAFPDMWIAPNTSLGVWHLYLGDNPGLTGTLPAHLPWINLKLLSLRGTQVRGTIPEQWCTAPFAKDLQQLDFVHTQINATLPCTARAMPKLTIATAQPAARGNASSAAAAGDGGGSGGGSARLLLLAVGAVATAAAVAAARKWQPWKRRSLGASVIPMASLLRRQQQHRQRDPQSSEDDVEELLAVVPGAQVERLRRRQPQALELVPGRARMKALVQRQMGGSAAPSGGWERQLVSRGKLPQELAHRMNSGRHPSGGDQLGSGGSKGSGSSGGSGGGHVPVVVRHWGLETDSLRISVSDLQFIAEPDGSLVQLGEGAHGVVYLAKMQDMYVAVKVFELQASMQSRAFWHEISLLARCMHPRVVPVYGVAMQNDLLMVAVQLMLGGSLRTVLLDPERQPELRWGARGRQVALDVAEALVYLHNEARILHSDVKSANALLTLEWRAALSDFGVAQVLANSARTAAGGSSLYAAPEQLLGKRCTLAADVYSMGLLLVELTTRQVIIRRGDWELPRPGVDCPQEVSDLIERCLSSDPLQRPSACEVLRCLRDSGDGSEG